MHTATNSLKQPSPVASSYAGATQPTIRPPPPARWDQAAWPGQPNAAAHASEHSRHEPYYAAIWCAEQGGRSEVRLASGNRADCITETHAIEVDWARKFRQGIGQSLDYAQETGKRAGILLLLRDERDYRYWIRLNTVIEYHQLPIDTWFRLVED